MPFEIKACACGIAEVDCEYHKPRPAGDDGRSIGMGACFGLDRSAVKLAGMNVAAAPAAPRRSSAWARNGDDWVITIAGVMFRYNVSGLSADQVEQLLLGGERALRANGSVIPA